MDRKTLAITLTVASAMLCACPGLSLCLLGAIAAPQGGSFDFATGSGDPTSLIGFAALCVGIGFVVIAGLVIFFAWQRKPAPPANINEPLPPAI